MSNSSDTQQLDKWLQLIQLYINGSATNSGPIWIQHYPQQTGAPKPMSTLLRTFGQSFDRQFIHSTRVAHIMALAFETGQNLLLYGRPGHGKSEMARYAAYTTLGRKDDTFIKSLGEGTSMADLYGGVDMKELNDSGAMRYFVDNSFMMHKIVIFEEIFDAPPSVLTSLKDTLTDKQFNNGRQVVKMNTEVVIGLTNKSPREIADLGPSEAALTERFPLQLDVFWPDYTADSYFNMFKKMVPPPDGSSRLPKALQLLARYLGDFANQGFVISPRSAHKLADQVLGNARLRNRQPSAEDVVEVLAYSQDVPASSLEELEQRARREVEKVQQQEQLQEFESKVHKVEQALRAATTPIPLCLVGKDLDVLEEALNNFSVYDDFHDARHNLVTRVAGMQQEAWTLAKQHTRRK